MNIWPHKPLIASEPPLINIFLSLYNVAWLAALPFLKRSAKVSSGWQQRTLKDGVQGPFDLWIQAASGGESQLTNMVLDNLAPSFPNKKLRILATSGTKQGIETLVKGCEHHTAGRSLDVTVAYFPFDAPHIMEQAFTRFAPKLAIIIETELWPGFLVTAKKKDIPVILINGRMSEKSFGSYKYFKNFFSHYGPEKVMAISPLDGERFSTVVGAGKVNLMNNIKFDRIEPATNLRDSNPISTLLPEGAHFILLGSIRREEEEKILDTVTQLLSKRQDIVIGLFPKHIERADYWIGQLEKARVNTIKRSEATPSQTSGTVIVWDVFGELAGAYALAGATFVGGSLVNLGGQNFLEPLVFGLRPIIGPYWKNFAWVGREIVDSGLVQEISDENELVTALLDAIEDQDPREEVIGRVQDFFAQRKGGTHQVCQEIIQKLHSLKNR